ncbi:MAG: carboxypeptidase regulatory-like domain-containing protein, partial [Acidobacteria bacterium]|nr:carboxypeptidase regulatory-like domain-containing protein [Acidobacteriota bacterium]
RGTNTLHGSIYEYYLDNNFNANKWDNNLTGTPNPSFHYSRFGASLGGPVIPKEILGGKTYLFGNYQGFRWPNSTTIERAVPTAAMRNGFLTFAGTTYNMKLQDPRGIGIDPTVQAFWNKYEPLPNDPGCGSLAGNGRCDGTNVQGFKANLATPQNDNFGVVRLDHDFSSKLHFMSSYRYYHLTRATTDQVDIGGFFAGDTLGVPSSTSNRPQVPWFLVAGLTANISSNVTNDFHYSYLRNYWAWNTQGGPAQVAGLGAAIEPLGESQTSSLVPFNVNAQQARTRFWDGQDNYFRDDVTMLHGNHLFQFGGIYQHNFNYHQRTDNGGGINYYPTYQLGDGAGAGSVDMSALGIPSSKTANRQAAAVLGIVTDSQIAYTRAGSNLSLNPPLTPAFDQSTIPFYNVYFSDSWHLRPSFTLTYGLGWTLEMPPTERNGKQIEFVDASDQPIDTEAYIASKQRAALQGQVFNPQVGFALLGNTANSPKYPYDPFYGSFSPRVAAAWNPHFGDSWAGKIFGEDKTVLRGGYGRIYGRLNGVDLVLVPLLGTGLIQAVQCTKVLAAGACGPATPNATTAFRIGIDGNSAPLAVASPTLPQPDFPGINAASAGAGEALDPHFRPNVVDSFDLTIQRQLSNRVTLEFGYIGRIIHHEYQPININVVPYMMTLGGQSFEQAYANVEVAMGCNVSEAKCLASGVPTIAPQPFFETALAGTGYCTPGTCTAAVIKNEFGNFQTQNVWSLWSDLDQGGIGGGATCATVGGCTNPNGVHVNQGQQQTNPGFAFSCSMLNCPLNTPLGGNGQLTSGVGINASIGHGNYNAGFVTMRMNEWRGLTLQQNFTYSKALGTGALVQATSSYTADDAFNLDEMYGVQAFNRKFVYNLFMVYQPPFFKNQQGVVGRLLGGWNISPIFTAGSGEPLYCNTQTDGQAFGSADANSFGTNEQCLFNNYNAGNSAHYGVSTTGVDAAGNNIGDAVATCLNATCKAINPQGIPVSVNMFANPLAVWNSARPPILGIDTRAGGYGPITGMPYWNLDLSVKKNFKVTERFSADFQVVFTNVLNHMVFADPGLGLGTPDSWGVITSQVNTPRQMEFGLRVIW